MHCIYLHMFIFLYVERFHPLLKLYTLFLPLDSRWIPLSINCAIWGLSSCLKEVARIRTPETGEGVDGRIVERCTPWVPHLTLLLTLIVSVYCD